MSIDAHGCMLTFTLECSCSLPALDVSVLSSMLFTLIFKAGMVVSSVWLSVFGLLFCRYL